MSKPPILLHPRAKDKPRSILGTSTTHIFAINHLVSFNISSQGVTPKFNTLGDVLMGRINDPHKQTTSMFQQVTKHSKNMFVVLLETLKFKLINQQVVEERR